MTKKALEIATTHGRDAEAAIISMTWVNYNAQRHEKIEDWKELRNYVFATDTTTTSNRTLPWKNSTTLPKLCQIRDNLHSNYISALFPNDDWLTWEAYGKEGAVKEKRDAIQAYMSNKTRISGFREIVSQLLYDYIDYGICFATPYYVNEFITLDSGEKKIDYIGPKAMRISPLDIVFNPLATSFKDSYKVVRSLKNIGELKLMSQSQPDNHLLFEAIEKRNKMCANMGTYGLEESDKQEGLLVDGFGSYTEYLQSGYIELLDFYGDVHNTVTGEIQQGRHITVIDRMYVVKNEPIPNWFGSAPIYSAGWRKRPDNLWAMGPLDNLVGMQYRIDHLENLKADAMDLAVMPPLVVQGEVEEFDWGPGCEIHIDENGSVTELGKNTQWVITATNDIGLLEQKMEQYAGAPREAMGIRSPGEKTMFEVQQLQNAAGRIFQEKITTFEIEVLEPLLNAMLECAARNLDRSDVVRVMDDDIGVSTFMTITKDDITASGKLRPIGARHFAAQAQLMQNIVGIANTPIWQQVAPHLSSKNMSKLLEDVMGLQRYQLFQPNVAVFEQQETARLAGQAQEDLQAEAEVPVQ